MVDADEPADDAEATRRFLASVYLVLTDLQDSLLRLMLADLPDEAPPAPPGWPAPPVSVLTGPHRRGAGPCRRAAVAGLGCAP